MNTKELKLGWIPDVPDKRDLFYSVRKPKAKKKIPDSIDLRKEVPIRFDQGSLGSCVGQATAAAIISQNFSQKDSWYIPSRLAIYYDARVLLGTVNYDSGCYIRDAFKVINMYGSGLEALWPYNVRQFKKAPTKEYYADAKKNQVIKYERVRQTEEDIISCLLSGTPFVFGFSVYSGFMNNLPTDGIMNLPQNYERMLGGHAVLGAAYATDLRLIHSRGMDLKVPSFAKKFKLWIAYINSWSDKVGDGGVFYMPIEYLLNTETAADLWRMTLVE